MKAVEDICIPNLRAFENTIQKEGMDSYFTVLKGKVIEDVCKLNGFTDEEVSAFRIRILKGNPHWVSLENEEEHKVLHKVNDERALEIKRREELFKLNKKEHTKLLSDLGVKKVPLGEPDCVEMILNLEKGKKLKVA